MNGAHIRHHVLIVAEKSSIGILMVIVAEIHLQAEYNVKESVKKLSPNKNGEIKNKAIYASQHMRRIFYTQGSALHIFKPNPQFFPNFSQIYR